MPHLIPNLFEKSYTPYTAKLAPKNLWSKPTLGKSALDIHYHSHFNITRVDMGIRVIAAI